MLEQKNYDALENFLVGSNQYVNSYLNTLDVEDMDREIFNSEERLLVSRDLSPYNNTLVKTKKREFPSLIKYILSLRLCYNAEIDKLIEAENINEIRKIINKNAEPCKKVFKKFSSQYNIKTGGLFVKDQFEDVDAYLIDKTNKGLDILYDIVPKSMIMKQRLLSTENKTIVFIDPDKILGDGLDGSGLNLYGKKLMQVRTMLKRVNVTRSLTEKVVPNIINYTESTTLTPFETWVMNKLKYVAKVSGLFFEYLCESRPGFLQISTLASIITPYEVTKVLVLSNDRAIDNYFLQMQKDEDAALKTYEVKLKQSKVPVDKHKSMLENKERDLKVTERVTGYKHQDEDVPRNGWKTSNKNLAQVKNFVKSLSVVNPIISGELTKTVIDDLFNCNIVESVSSISFPMLGIQTSNFIKSLIRQGINNQYLKNMTEISEQACNNIYQYVLSLAEYIIVNSVNSNEPDFVKIAKQSEESVMNQKRDFEFYGFNDDNKNAISQCMLSIILAITDWLDLDYASMQEFKFVENLLGISVEKEDVVNLTPLETNPDKIPHSRLITKMFNENGIILYSQDVEYICNLLFTISKEMQTNDVLKNRVYFYANFV